MMDASPRLIAKHVDDDENDVETIVAVIECLEKEGISQYLDNIHEICKMTYEWSKPRTKAALIVASEEGFVLEITFKGLTTYRTTPTFKDSTKTRKNRSKSRHSKRRVDKKTDVDIVVGVIRELRKKDEEPNFLNVFKSLVVHHSWSDERISGTLSLATKKGFVMEITFKGCTTYRIPLSVEKLSDKDDAIGESSRNNDGDKTDVQVVFEVVESLRKEEKGQYFENIYNTCASCFDWTEIRTKTALNTASQKGLIVEITYKGKTSYRVPILSRGMSTQNIATAENGDAATKKGHRSKTDAEIVVDVVKYLDKKNVGHCFENIFDVCSETYDWDDARTRTALNDASKKGFIAVITFKEISTYQIAPLSEVLSSVRNKKDRAKGKAGESRRVKDDDIEKWLDDGDNVHFYDDVMNVKEVVENEMRELSNEMKRSVSTSKLNEYDDEKGARRKSSLKTQLKI